MWYIPVPCARLLLYFEAPRAHHTGPEPSPTFCLDTSSPELRFGEADTTHRTHLLLTHLSDLELTFAPSLLPPNFNPHNLPYTPHTPMTMNRRASTSTTLRYPGQKVTA